MEDTDGCGRGRKCIAVWGVGVGHGISKMAPILQDIALKIKNNSEAVKLKKVDLFWLIENQTYFEWFTKFLHEIQNEEKLNIFNYNIFEI